MGKLKPRKIYLGTAKPRTKVTTVNSLRIDQISRQDAKEAFSEWIDAVYDSYEADDGYFDATT